MYLKNCEKMDGIKLECVVVIEYWHRNQSIRIVVVPGKLSNDIPKGTLSAIFKQAQIGD